MPVALATTSDIMAAFREGGSSALVAARTLIGWAVAGRRDDVLSVAAGADAVIPGLAEALRRCAVVFMRADDMNAALVALDGALRLEPELRDARLMRARLHARRGEGTLACEDLAAILARQPLDADAVGALAMLTDAAGRRDLQRRTAEAIAATTTASAVEAAHATSLLTQLEAFAEAGALLARWADDRDPVWRPVRAAYALAVHDRALLAQLVAEPEDAQTPALRLALAMLDGDRDAVRAAYPAALSAGGVDRARLIEAGIVAEDYGRAFRAPYETPAFAQLSRDIPNWHPLDAPLSALDGKRVLVIGFTELGDEIRLIDLLDRARARFAACAFVVDARLAPLVARGRPELEVVGVDKRRPSQAGAVPSPLAPFIDEATWARAADFDAVIMLRQLESALIKRAEDLPQRRRVLEADPAAIARWTGPLEALGPAPRIGLFWRSSRTNFRRQNRVTALEDWRPVLTSVSATSVCLQFGDDVEAEVAASASPVHMLSGLDARDDLESLAAVMSTLDLVVTAPAATMHLAGALGVETLCVAHPSQRLFRSRPGTDQGLWSPSITVASGPPDQGFAGAIAAAAARLPALLRGST